MKKRVLQINLTLSFILILLVSVSAQDAADKKQKIAETTAFTLSTVPGEKLQKVFAAFGVIVSNNLAAKFTENIKREINSQKGLTEAQKKQAIEKSPILVERLNSFIKQSAIEKFVQLNAGNEQYYKESFAKYSDEELEKLYSFLISPAGKRYLSLLKQISDNRFAEQPKEIIVEEQYKPQIKEFVDAPVGVKYQETINHGNALMAEKIKSVPNTFGAEMTNNPRLMKIVIDFVNKELVK